MFTSTAETEAQDQLRPLRAFVGAMNGWLGSDQSMAGQDASASNPPRQFVTLGPQGVSLEGTQTSAPAAAGGLGFVLQPWMIAAGLAAGAFLLLRRA
jgi:hypothetical protein